MTVKQCACDEFWPGQGHPPDCPTQPLGQLLIENRSLHHEIENRAQERVDLLQRITELEMKYATVRAWQAQAVPLLLSIQRFKYVYAQNMDTVAALLASARKDGES